MPNTTNVSQTLPIFAQTKNGQSAIELKTQNNNNFNQLLKSEVANKAKKTQVDNARQQANNKTLSTPPKPNSTKIESHAKSPNQNLSTIDKESDEGNQTASAPIENTNALLNFVGDIQALARPANNNNSDAEPSADPSSIASQNVLTPLSLDTAASTQIDANRTTADAFSTDTNSTTEKLGNGFADHLTKAASDGIIPAPKDASKTGTNTQFVTENSVSVEQDPPPHAQDSTAASTLTVELSIHQQPGDKLEKLAKLDTAVSEAKQEGQGEQIIAADRNTSADITLDKKPPTLHSEKQMIDTQVAILNANRRVTTLESTSTEKESPTEISTELSSAELAPTDRRIALNANERSASDQFSIDLKAHTQEARESDVDQQPQNKQEIKITELPRAESLTPAPQIQASVEANSVSATSNFIGPRVGTKMWDQAIGQKIVWMVAGGEQSAQLTLNPPDLGPVQVVLSISDNQIDASFVSSHLDVREAIEAAAPKLREMMDSAGMSLTGFSVNAQSTASSNAFGSSGENRNNGSASHANRSTGADSKQDTPTTLTTSSNRSSANGLVDTFV